MSLLNPFAAARTDAPARKAKLARRPTLDALERREVCTAGVGQAGSTLGLAWRFAPDGSSSGGGTLYVQDVAKGADAADRSNAPIAINQQNGHVVFDTDASHTYTGPAVANGAQVKIVLGATSGDIDVYDDRDGGAGGLTTIDRHQTGRINMAGSWYVNFTFDENVVTQQATLNLQSGATDKATYNINPTSSYLDSDDPNYAANSGAMTGLEVSDQGGESGGVSFLAGTHVRVVTSGGATFVNNLPA